MGEKIRISPLTRINGFWNLEVLVEGGKITDAWSSGIFFRGLENILKGRDPRDAVYLTERICGICSTAHAIAAAHAIEDAIKLNITRNAMLLRKLIFAADLLQNHLRHFYLLVLPDYIQLPDKPPFVPRYKAVYNFTKAETDFAIESYNQHFEITRLCHEMLTILGGKAPHQHAIVAGGVTAHPTVANIQKYMGMLYLVEKFIDERVMKDMETIAKRYADYYEIGEGYRNLLAYGNFVINKKQHKFLMPFGVYTNEKIEKFEPDKIREYVHRSWYKESQPRHPRVGETVPELDKESGYSWVKAPRYDGKPFETGPLAHLWMKGDYRRGFSTIDRLMARVLETKLIAGQCRVWSKELEPGKPVYQPFELPNEELEGVGFTGAMRGALGHWIRIKGDKILNYQVITPAAWYCSPRDDKGQRGPVEQALIGTPVADTANPIEIGRVVRSYDPCLACAVHMIKPNGEKILNKIII